MQIYGLMTRLVSPNQKYLLKQRFNPLAISRLSAMRPNLGHSDRCLPFLKPVVRLLPGSDSPKDRVWDKAVVPMPQVERHLLPGADVQCLSA